MFCLSKKNNYEVIMMSSKLSVHVCNLMKMVIMVREKKNHYDMM